MKKLLLVLLLIATVVYPQIDSRKEINIPDIPGYRTLKCDFHMHTVFSDGDVWPTVRVEEAWREGLDAIALTDHVEYQPKKDYIPTNHNSPYAIALNSAADCGILLIKGAEITRGMPPGHINAIFLKDANALIKDNWKDAVKEACDQGAFIFWNHPWWIGQQPDEIARWYDEHTYLFENKLMMGIEIANGPENSMDVFDWCLKKKLTVLGNSDNHSPISMDYDLSNGEHRTVTLVFAKSKSVEEIHVALKEGRTAVYQANKLFGKEEYLKPIFENSIKVERRDITAEGRKTVFIPIKNNSDLTYHLELKEGIEGINFPKTIKLAAGKMVMLAVRAANKNITMNKTAAVKYDVKNLMVAKESCYTHTFEFDFSLKPASK